MATLDSFGTVKPSLAITLFFILGPLFPGLFSRMSNQRTERIQTLVQSVKEIAEEVLERVKAEGDSADGDEGDQSIIGLLSKDFFSTPMGFVKSVRAIVYGIQSNLLGRLRELICQLTRSGPKCVFTFHYRCESALTSGNRWYDMSNY